VSKIQNFRTVPHNFQGMLKSMGQPASLDAASEQVLMALSYCSATIQDLKDLVDKFAHDGKGLVEELQGRGEGNHFRQIRREARERQDEYSLGPEQHHHVSIN
jgi:hypothetical protein